MSSRPLTEKLWRTVLAFRVALRGFLHWSEKQAAAAGLTAAQHQLLVAIQGHPGKEPPRISDVAGSLFIRDNSAIAPMTGVEALGVV